MSLNDPPLKVVKVIDPRLNINNEREYVALKGSKVNSWQQFNATTLNNSNVQITCNPPSSGIGISRLIFKKFVFSGTITGTNTTNPAAPLLSSGFHGPRAYPIACVTSTESVTINNGTITQAPISQYWPALMWYHNKLKTRFGQLSLTPSMLDQYQNYSDGVGTIRNPLADYGDNSYEDARGSYIGYVINGNTNGSTSVTFELTCIEPILISPFKFGEGSNETSCLIGAQNMSYSSTLGDLSNVLSLIQDQGAPGQINLTNVQVQLQSASLLFNYFTPDPIMPLPRSLVSSYYTIVSYPTASSNSIPPNGSVTLQMQSIQVHSIPRKLYIYARYDDNVKSPYMSDAYFALPQNSKPLTVNWDTNQFFSQASSQDLYNMSVKNGYGGSYSQWSRHTGSIICIEFGTDLGLSSNQSPGSLGNYQLGLTCNFVNANQTLSIIPTLYVIVVYEGTVTIKDGATELKQGVLTPNDVENSQIDPFVNYKSSQDVFGGSFFSSLKRGFGKINDALKKSKVISKLSGLVPHPYAGPVSRAAAELGYGLRGEGVSGGQMKPRKSNKITKAELKKRLMGGSVHDEEEYEYNYSDNDDIY